MEKMKALLAGKGLSVNFEDLLPEVLTAGAVLSGAYFGDRCSPMSSCATLVAACTDTKLYSNVREMLKTAALPTVLCILYYAILSVRNPITTVDDLFAEGASHIIGVQRNTTGDLYSTWDLEDAGLASVDRYSKGADAVQALLTGKVDCVVIDNEPAKAFVAETSGLKILDTEYVLEEYAAAMSKDNKELFEAVNKALEELIADGTVAAIVNKYIPAE